MDQFTVTVLEGNRLKSFAQRPANGTRGGIILLWDELVVEVNDVTSSTYCLCHGPHQRRGRALQTDICLRAYRLLLQRWFLCLTPRSQAPKWGHVARLVQF